MNGIINFYKPKGMTSHRAVNFLRKKLNIRRIGHTGTLDPSVSGVLPLCIGKATRVSEYIIDGDKEYIGELTLGFATDTQDMDGIAIKSSNKKVSEEKIIEAFSKYQGDIIQIPPMYSAVRHKGQQLYKLAREGIEVERKERHAHIYENEILEINGNKILFRIKCSKGTYIRTICNDIGEDLGTFGYMSYLIRTEVENFKIDDAVGKETIENMSLEEIESIIIPMDVGAKNLEEIILEDKNHTKISHGRMIKLDGKYLKYDMEKEYRVYCYGEFMGIGEIIQEDNVKKLKMKKVLLV